MDNYDRLVKKDLIKIIKRQNKEIEELRTKIDTLKVINKDLSSVAMTDKPAKKNKRIRDPKKPRY